ncbi:6-phosphofructokinase [Nordella sp. HKS 07]|uniref:ADP-dependent glucokinase/phosphofructokinase n=1 Tax=Nordella sp. HKS 07 TaxID=2712222 RepID=UPI0013E1A7EE|nr:ADP-dependent glucokinase/phosphofructokinase [Nordella sp. HKS 07]QIG49857.1 6-phosphofructokinase [Nordella sp. HKS 07]
MSPHLDWAGLYRDLIADIPRIAREAPLMLFGLSACVDARIFAHDLIPLFEADAPEPARAFGKMVKERAVASIGGEVRIDWPEGPGWLAAHVPISYALGGTGPQAAWSLAAIGAPALIALEDRSAHKLAQIHPDILIAENGKAVRAADVVARGPRQPEIFIIEYTAGRAIDGAAPRRSSRIIVRFHDPGLEHDAQFETLSAALAHEAGAGLISGFNSIPYELIDSEVAQVTGMIQKWRAAGLGTVHLELAGYDTPRHRDRTVERLTGFITSIGMSHSEFLALAPGNADLASDMCALGDRLGLDRVCVHADHWAAAATRGDPQAERQALMMGCLLAGTRAAHGVPAYPRSIDTRATFATPPLPPLSRHGDWSLVACASPYLDHPAATVGLGDSFTGGCLLVLGSANSRNSARTRHGEPVKAG